jgi:hypothetical protein
VGGPAAHTLEGAAPLQTTQQQKGAPLRGGQRASLAFSGRALAPLPHPPRASTKTKTWLWMVGVGPAFAPECRVVRDRTERPQDEHGAMPPAPGYPKYVYGHSATGPRVMNPAFHFVSNRVYSAPRTSPARAFSRVNRCTCAAHVCATIPPLGCRFSARIGCTCARTWGTCAR